PSRSQALPSAQERVFDVMPLKAIRQAVAFDPSPAKQAGPGQAAKATTRNTQRGRSTTRARIMRAKLAEQRSSVKPTTTERTAARSNGRCRCANGNRRSGRARTVAALANSKEVLGAAAPRP